MQTKQIQDDWKRGYLLLAGVGLGLISEEVLRWTSRLAGGLNSPWIAVYVQVSPGLSESERSQLSQNLALARELGAEVITTNDSDVARGLLRVARQRNVTQIIVGNSLDSNLWKRRQGNALLRQLRRESGNIEIRVIGIARADNTKVEPRGWKIPERATLTRYLIAIGAVAATTLLNFFLDPIIGYHAIAFIFLLVVVMLASFIGRGPTLIAATTSALLWDFFFQLPRYSFRIESLDDQILFGMYFVVALVLGQLTAKISAQQKAEHQREERATALYLLTRELTGAANVEQLLQRIIPQLERAFRAQVTVLLSKSPNQMSWQSHPASTFQITEKERCIAAWVFEHGQPAGRFTDKLPDADGLHVPLQINDRMLGLMSFRFGPDSCPTIHERNLLDAFSQQISLAIDRLRLNEDSEKAKLTAESERLSKTLLNSVSHEIRTPLAAIQGSTSNLLELNNAGLSGSQRAMIAEIQEGVERLNRLIGKVLDITRLESGHVKPRYDFYEVDELVHDAVEETRKELARHSITVDVAPGLPPVRMDYGLMHQALKNLLSNAAFHTPPGTVVLISAKKADGDLMLVVEDHGPGIRPEFISRIFDKFYRAPTARAGGTGLGLSIVKGFVEAQGGRISVDNHVGGGAVFTIRLALNNIQSSNSQSQTGAGRRSAISMVTALFTFF